MVSPFDLLGVYVGPMLEARSRNINPIKVIAVGALSVMIGVVSISTVTEALSVAPALSVQVIETV